MAKNFSSIARVAMTFAFLALAACGGGDNEGGGANPPPPPPPPPQTGIGAAGGVVTGPSGAKVEIPAGALTTNVDIKVEQSSAGSPPLPAGFTAVGPMFAFTPHGTQFTLPATITLPFDPASAPSGSTPMLIKTNAQTGWETVAGTMFGPTSVSAPVTGFSFAQVVIPAIVRNEPTRTWDFGVFPGNGSPEINVGGNTQVGGVLDQTVEFGPSVQSIDIVGPTTTVPGANKAHGHVFGTADGVTYGAYAEAPFAELGGPDPIGSISRLTQSQSFIKRKSNATLRFTFTKVLLSVGDFNLFAPSIGYPDTNLSADVFVEVRAYSANNPVLFHTAGGAVVSGHRSGLLDTFGALAWTYPFARTPLWSPSQFLESGEDLADAHCTGRRASLELREPLRFTVDVSSLEIGEEFTLNSDIHASATNRRGGGASGDCEGSGALAYLRDPLDVGGATIEFDGLEPTNRPLPVPPLTPIEPVACASGAPDPEAGVLQFESGTFSVGEQTGAIPVIAITRTGGTRGEVTATFATGGGTAESTADYTPLSATVFFADGDDSPRVIAVPIAADSIDEPDETVNLSLSQPGGCAQLGDQTSALVTIVDDDLPPSTGSPGALDATFGTGGKANIERFGGDRSAMAVQADGKIVMVGGTFTDFIMARFNADGTVDSTFDGDGRVTTKIVSGQQQEALAVVVQPDGKIVVAGYSGPPGGGPSRVALARYTPDGNLDAGFGSQGKVVSDVAGEAYAITIQPDGKLLVAGRSPRSNGADTSDFVVARFANNGALDTTFATGGIRITDIGGATNTARNIVLQPNGAIVVSGQAFDSTVDHTDVARYDANGNLDATFGTGGTLALSGSLVGHGLAVSSDGKLVLVGSIVVPNAPTVTNQFLVRRLNADGSTDITFGAGGSVVTDISGRGDAALAVALQQDGKIVVAGLSSIQANPNFAVTRYLVSGAIDTSFANAGKQTVDFFGFADGAESVLVQPDGKIVVGGFAEDDFDGYGVVRINP
jgi:uncharacterized delta-60 repeat protein